VVFHSLGRGQIRAISKIQIDYLRRRLQDREIGFEISEAALDLLGEAGFDPVYGARPMKRAIQQQLENPLAQQILAGNFVAGDIIKVDVEHETLRFLKG
jgi:ATP-dependent Clp protease ATP-binding subunit ClpB